MNAKEYALLLYMTSSEFYIQRLVFDSNEFHFNINLKDSIYYELYGILNIECEMELTDEAKSYPELYLCEQLLKGNFNSLINGNFTIYADLFYLTNIIWQLDEKTSIISDEKYVSSSCNSLLNFNDNVSLDIYDIKIDISKYKFMSFKYNIYKLSELDCLLKIGNKQDIDLIINIRDSLSEQDIKTFYNIEGFHSICFQCEALRSINIICNSLCNIEKVNTYYNIIGLSKFIFDTEIDGVPKSIIGKSNNKILQFLLKYFDDIQLY